MLTPRQIEAVDAESAYGGVDRTGPDGRPWIVACMVASADGAATVDGVSGSLGGDADKDVFDTVRSLADVVLVAAGTVRAEGYGAAHTPSHLLAGRQARGQHPNPRIAVVSRSLDLDPAGKLFVEAEPDASTIVITTADADRSRRAGLAEVAEVIEAGTDQVDLTRAVGALGAAGASVVVTEGGPSLIGQLSADDLLDELCLTVAPVIVAGSSVRIARSGTADLRHFTLAHVLEAEGVLLLRYVRRR